MDAAGYAEIPPFPSVNVIMKISLLKDVNTN